MGNLSNKKKKVKKERMKNVTIALPEFFVKHLEGLRERGMIVSRSDGIRIALRQFLIKEIKVYNMLNNLEPLFE